MFPIPSSKDFKKTKRGDTYIVWECKAIIQAYIDTLEVPSRYNKSEFDSILVRINNKFIRTCVSVKDDVMFELFHVGSWISNSLSESKKETLKFFKYLQENPESIKKLFEYANEAYAKRGTAEFMKSKTWNKILGY